MALSLPARVIGHFDALDAPGFARWLASGIYAYFRKAAGTEAFGVLGPYLEGEGHPSEGLANLFVHLGEPGQRAFREGLALSFAEFRVDANTRTISDTYLLTAQATGAWQVFQVLDDKLRQGSEASYLRSPEYLRFVTRTLLSLAIYPGDGLLAGRQVATFRLLGSLPNFPASESGNLLIALTRFEPTAAYDNLVAVGRSLVRVFGYGDDSSDEENRSQSRRRLTERLAALGHLATTNLLVATANQIEFDWLSTSLSVAASPLESGSFGVPVDPRTNNILSSNDNSRRKPSGATGTLAGGGVEWLQTLLRSGYAAAAKASQGNA